MSNQWESLLDELVEANEGEATRPTSSRSGLVPANDIRLTINIKKNLHHKLKVRAAQNNMTIGDMIEKWIKTMS